MDALNNPVWIGDATVRLTVSEEHDGGVVLLTVSLSVQNEIHAALQGFVDVRRVALADAVNVSDDLIPLLLVQLGEIVWDLDFVVE